MDAWLEVRADAPAVMVNPIRPYTWGSRTAIARMQGRQPSSSPEAELWMGAHPSSPSQLRVGNQTMSIGRLIENAPHEVLGGDVLARFGQRLPFLVKVLAVDSPLSLQAHPSSELAAGGYHAEEARGLPREAPERNYKDPSAKPELLCALTSFDAFCGFRSVPATAALLDRLGVDRLQPLAVSLRGDAPQRALRDVVGRVLTWPAEDRRTLVAEVTAAARRLSSPERGSEAAAAWVARLGTAYPTDPGVVCALLLNLVRLAPGEAVFLPAGNLHAHLHGVGIEVMASSENVLRGGLTAKHVDVADLQRVLDLAAGPIPLVEVETLAAGEEVFRTPAPEFRLSRLQLSPRQAVTLVRSGPEVLLCTEGEAQVRHRDATIGIGAGSSVFIPSAAGPVELRGHGLTFRATVPPPPG